MAPTVVLFKIPITHPTNTFAMNSTTSNNRPNNKFPLPASIGGSDSSPFDVYQQASVGSGNVTIRTLVPAPISAEPYRKTLIAKLFFCQIISLIDTPSVSFSDLMSTVASYFSLNTGSAEREAEAAVICLRSAFFASLICRGFGWLVSPENPFRFQIPITAL